MLVHIIANSIGDNVLIDNHTYQGQHLPFGTDLYSVVLFPYHLALGTCTQAASNSNAFQVYSVLCIITCATPKRSGPDGSAQDPRLCLPMLDHHTPKGRPGNHTNMETWGQAASLHHEI